MASITSTGIGSGLDIAGLVQQLVAAEAAPVSTRIAQKEARVQTKLSAFGSLKSALSDFRDQLDKMRTAKSFLTRSATSGNEDLFSVSVSESALPATYSVDVTQLAQTQKLTSGTFSDKDTVVGTGTLTITVGSAAFNIDVTAENNTLAGIRDSINGALDNTGVSATIVNADAGSYLILTGENTGAANSMTVTQAGGDGGLAALEYDPGAGLKSLTESIAAQDALVKIDGFDVLSSTNKITGAVDGVTLDLLQADPGFPASLQIDNDTDAVTQ
ncbi:MAG: flagellar filament capping protein FliD, partial [Gammaproteobacteria bacterium]